MRTVTRLLCVLMILGATAAFGGTLNLSTGFNALGSIISTDRGCDAHWTVTGPTNISCTGSAAQVVLSGDNDYYSGWSGNTSSSDWVAADSAIQYGFSPLPTFTESFYLTDTTGATITGSVEADEDATVYLNGNAIAALSGNTWGAFTAISAGSQSFLVAGLNTLTVTFTHNDNTDGMRFQGSVTGDGATFVGAATPEPISSALLLLGLGALAARKRIRRRNDSAL